MIVIVGHKQIAASWLVVSNVFLRTLEKIAVVVPWIEVRGVQIPMRPMINCKYSRERRAQRDLDTLDGVQEQQPQLPVKGIKIDDVVEAWSINEPVSVFALSAFLKRQHVP